MWSHNFWNLKSHRPRFRDARLIFDGGFSYKISSLLIFLSLTSALLLAAPLAYYSIQNYAIFSKLSYEQAPDLLRHIEREYREVWMLMACSIIAVIVMSSIVATKLAHRILAPIKIMKSHLKLLSRGEWSSPPIRVREDDEFQDLIEAYNYFYQSFRIQLQNDLRRISQLSVDKNNHDAYLAWKSLIDEKSRQLNVLNVSSASRSPDQRHVS